MPKKTVSHLSPLSHLFLFGFSRASSQAHPSFIVPAQGRSPVSQERQPRHQKAQGLDKHHLQKTQDPRSRSQAQVRQKERPEGADLRQVRSDQVPRHLRERHQDHRRHQHPRLHRRQKSQQAHHQEGLQRALQHQGFKSQHPR